MPALVRQHRAMNANRARWILPAALVMYAGAALIGTHVPRLPHAISPAAGLISDKLAHFIAYTGLTLLVLGVGLQSSRLRGLCSSAGSRRGFVIAGAMSLAVYGLIDEATQPFFGRNFDWYDWLANLAGISTATSFAALVLVIQRRAPRVVRA